MDTFAELAEIQPLASKIITNSIRKDRISHAYLVQGARGTGKRAIATLLAKKLFCEHPNGVEPCNTCNMCKRIDSHNHPDVHWIEPDGKTIKKEQMAHLQKEFSYSGMETNKKVYIVTAADTLTPNAANRILKFLEEPSRQTIAILLTENSQSILPTIRSRCQVIDLKPLNPERFKQQLIEKGMQATNAALIATLTNDIDEALQLNDDNWFAQARKTMVQLIATLAENVNDAYLSIHSQWEGLFKERKQQELGLDLLLLGFRDLLYFHMEKTASMVLFQPDGEKTSQLAIRFSQEKLIAILQLILKAKQNLKQNVHPTLVMEQLVLQIQG
ncbi:DNA polymerase III subunit delta' [Virgibacillus sp. 179-BFC.A HS]|uniref:DNA polymerase III subunit delta n=1 Tax=Tigheibacillus jepli TaxID=3035914 RepID=A0ABU5CCK1_9BACI|nr:DNA polymerase III subunit delta' [Virgibacillus sp. 179-BFC.A HS]MDY0404055.1 DNA polymerase III subunit delta' [Virgibacillus sp. 179-BFC.A HS]